MGREGQSRKAEQSCEYSNSRDEQKLLLQIHLQPLYLSYIHRLRKIRQAKS